MSDPSTAAEASVLDEAAALQKQLDAARDAADKARDRRERASQIARMREELETAQREAREEEALAEAEAQYGPIGKKLGRVTLEIGGMVLVKPPDGIKFRQWQDQHQDKITHDALRQLVRPCVVYPPSGDFDALIADRPAALMHVANKVHELAGFKLKQIGGK
jgi:multidrug efflux pump subunit AcrA (membrane-fusion protein)